MFAHVERNENNLEFHGITEVRRIFQSMENGTQETQSERIPGIFHFNPQSLIPDTILQRNSPELNFDFELPELLDEPIEEHSIDASGLPPLEQPTCIDCANVTTFQRTSLGQYLCNQCGALQPMVFRTLKFELLGAYFGRRTQSASARR